MLNLTFIKLSPTGEELPRDATSWSAVRVPELGIEVTAQTLTDKRVDHQQATKIAAELELLGHKDWRLPTRQELCCLVNDSRIEPAIDTEFFPDTRSSWYWSSSLYAGVSGYAWFVGFSYGSANCYYRDGNYGFVRAVRSVAPASPGQ